MENITRTKLNNRHKIVYLTHNGKRVQAFEYCLEKGQLLGRQIIKENSLNPILGTVDVLHLDFYINGYYAYFEIWLHTDNGFNPQSALYWDNNTLLQNMKQSHWRNGVSIYKDKFLTKE